MNRKSNLKIYQLIIIGLLISIVSILSTKIFINCNNGVYTKNNISKGDKPLNIIQDRWLISQIKEYEFISDEERNLYSCAENYKSLFDKQRKIYLETFKKEREYQ